VGHSLEDETLTKYFSSSYGIFSGEPAAIAHLSFTGRAAMRMRGGLEWHPEQKQQNNEDGSVELWPPYSDDRELIRDIMGYGHEVLVLAPDALRDSLINHYKMALAAY
jgi:predicted DNA-binding transcriptional regulator YafY